MSLTNIGKISALESLIQYLKDQNYRFTTTTPLTHQRVNARHQNTLSETLRDAFGWNRPFRRDVLPDDLFTALKQNEAVVADGDGWRSRVRASSIDQDLLLHSGYPTTEPDAVFLGPDTYRFCRLIREVLADYGRPLKRAVDIGCGTGAGGLTIARNAACNELIWTDISQKALNFCTTNLKQAGMADPRVVHSDLFANLEGNFDLIVANPPYLNDPLQRAYRHGGGSLGSQLSVRIAVEAVAHLSLGGTLILYTGSPIVEGEDRLRSEIERGLWGHPVQWSYQEIDPDVFGEELELTPYQCVERIAVVALVMMKVGDGDGSAGVRGAGTRRSASP